jgi:tetratricopeptide (TPR) repeat protein
MVKKPNILIRFWQELKRRKVFKVLAMYAGSAFVVIQVIDILTNRLNLPPWIATLVIIILSVGFPVTAILAWIFDLTPEGIKKTESIEELAGKVTMPPPARRRLKASDIAIAVLAIAVLVLAWPKIFRQDTLKRLRSSGEKLAIAVMPFQNMTNDTTLNIWQNGIQLSLISALSNTEELKVREEKSIKTLLQTQGLNEYASISPAIAGTISKKLDADIFIYGNIQKAGSRIRLDAQLIDTKTNDVLKSIEADGPYKEEIIFDITDSLRKKVTDFLIISKLIKGERYMQHLFTPPKSAEALRYFIYGVKASENGNFSEAIDWGLKSLAADSNFSNAAFLIEASYSKEGNQEQNGQWLIRNYERRDQMSYCDQLYASWAYAFSFESPEEQIKYLKRLLDIDDQDPSMHYLLGMTYCGLQQYDKAIPELERSFEILKKWGKENLENTTGGYFLLGNAYNKTGQFKKEKKLLKEAEHYIPGTWLNTLQALLAFSEKDTIKANSYIEKFISVKKGNSDSEADIANGVGDIYGQAGLMDKAEEYYRKALSLEPENVGRIYGLAYFSIISNRNLNEVPELMDKAMKLAPNKIDYYNYLDMKGWSLYKQGKYQESLEILQITWDEAPFKFYSIRSHLEEVKKAVEGHS